MGDISPIRFDTKKMKIFAASVLALAAADEKKVPPRHPLQRLNKLNKFAAEWCTDNLTQKQAANWIPKFEKNTHRFERRFEICGFYDEFLLPHGGPEARKRRSAGADDDELVRYDKENPIRGIQQITTGYSKWAKRYIETCKLQPGTQVDRASKWFNKLVDKLAKNNSL